MICVYRFFLRKNLSCVCTCGSNVREEVGVEAAMAKEQLRPADITPVQINLN
jgi:hypothetical protein